MGNGRTNGCSKRSSGRRSGRWVVVCNRRRPDTRRELLQSPIYVKLGGVLRPIHRPVEGMSKSAREPSRSRRLRCMTRFLQPNSTFEQPQGNRFIYTLSLIVKLILILIIIFCIYAYYFHPICDFLKSLLSKKSACACKDYKACVCMKF